jgi:hypothetical protein
MRFDDIHGVDRRYAVLTRKGRVKDFTFAMKGFGCYSCKDNNPKAEARFQHLLDLFKVKYVYQDVSF